MDLKKANEYFEKHFFSDKWDELEEDKQESALETAKNILKSRFNLRDGAEDEDCFNHAVYEQALHLVNFDKERLQMKQQGVTYYAVDGLTFTMDTDLVSPVAKGFLKSITTLRVGCAK